MGTQLISTNLIAKRLTRKRQLVKISGDKAAC